MAFHRVNNVFSRKASVKVEMRIKKKTMTSNAHVVSKFQASFQDRQSRAHLCARLTNTFIRLYPARKRDSNNLKRPTLTWYLTNDT